MFIKCQNYAEMLMKNELILYKWEEYKVPFFGKYQYKLVFVLAEIWFSETG